MPDAKACLSSPSDPMVSFVSLLSVLDSFVGVGPLFAILKNRCNQSLFGGIFPLTSVGNAVGDTNVVSHGCCRVRTKTERVRSCCAMILGFVLVGSGCKNKSGRVGARRHNNANGLRGRCYTFSPASWFADAKRWLGGF